MFIVMPEEPQSTMALTYRRLRVKENLHSILLNYWIETNEALHFKRREWSRGEGRKRTDLTLERSYPRLQRGVRGAGLSRPTAKKPSQTPCQLPLPTPQKAWERLSHTLHWSPAN